MTGPFSTGVGGIKGGVVGGDRGRLLADHDPTNIWKILFS